MIQTAEIDQSSRQAIAVKLGGPDDPFRDFPSTTSARARRHYEETGEPLVIYTFGHHVISFIQTHCVFTDAEYAAQPFVLMAWQKRLLLEMYEVRWVKATKRSTGRWLRVHRWAVVGIPKKNGKTELAGALGVYHSIDDGEVSARVVCAAASDEQAGLLYTAASRMCEWSPTISKFADVLDKSITFQTGHQAPSEMRKVAAASGTNDGKNLAAVLIDEFHEWVQPKHRAVFVVLTQGGGARKQPLNIIITTAGSDQESDCYEMYEHGQLVMAGEVEDPTLYFCWFEAPADADYRDPATWKAANPSWGLILDQAFYEDIITKRSESEFCRYFLNRWMESDDIWEAAGYWDGLDDCGALDPALPVYVGIDIGRRTDTAAVITTQWTGTELLVRTKFWTNPFSRADPRHAKWALTIAEVEQHLREIYAAFPEAAVVDDDGYREPGPAFLYDPHFFVRSAELLEGDGLNMVEFPQTDAKMVPASQNLFELIKTGALKHDHSRRMHNHMRSVVPKMKERGWRIARPAASTKAIDGAVALAMAAYAASAEFQHKEDQFNIW